MFFLRANFRKHWELIEIAIIIPFFSVRVFVHMNCKRVIFGDTFGNIVKCFIPVDFKQAKAI